MPNNNIGLGQNGRSDEQPVRKPYHAPLLTSLGPMEALVRAGGNSGLDATNSSANDGTS